MNAVDLTNTEERLLGRILRRQAETIPDVDFLIEDREHYSYGRVNQLANSCAAGFAKIGIERGDTVTFLMNSCPDYAFATLGLNKMGGVWVPTNTDYKGTWLRESLEDSRARVLVADADLLPKLEISGRVACPSSAFWCAANCLRRSIRWVFRWNPSRPSMTCRPSNPTMPTSTTATPPPSCGRREPLAVPRASCRATTYGSEALRRGPSTSGMREGDRLYNCLPMYQSASWVANIFRALVSGVPCGLDPTFSASEFWDRCRHYDATMVFTLGAMHIFLWNAPEKEDDADNPVRVASMIPCRQTSRMRSRSASASRPSFKATARAKS